MQKLKPRPYQAAAINEIRNYFSKGLRKVLLMMPTGSGKTFCFSKMIQGAVQNELHCMVLVRGRKLVDQASDRLFRESVPHGVMMNQHWNYRPVERVQVCSVDTIIARKIRPKADLIIIDEAHQAGSKGYRDVIADYPDAFIVGVTATPWVDKGLRHLAEEIVSPVTMQELIDQKFLVPFKYYAPSMPNLDNVKISKGTKDYVNEDLARSMVSGNLTGSIIDHWKELAENRKTLCFAVNIKHSKILVDRFNKAGIPALHCDAESSDDERKEAQAKLESGEIKILSNVGIFCTGVDIPSLGAIIMARPTKSLNLYIQQAGRGTRIFEGKENCIILDHAGNAEEHGLPNEDREVNLDAIPKRKVSPLETKTCKECFCVYIGPTCPECGAVPPPPTEAEIKEAEGKLKELTAETYDPIASAHKQLIKEAKKRGYKKGWAHHRLVQRFGAEACVEYVPDYVLNFGLTNNAFKSSPFGR